MANKSWWKTEEKILHRFERSDSYVSKKEFPKSLKVRFRKSAFNAELISGTLMLSCPWLFLIWFQEKIHFNICITITLMGAFLIFTAFYKRKNFKFDLTETSISFKNKSILWNEIREAQEVYSKKDGKWKKHLRLLKDSGKEDIWLSLELDTGATEIYEFIEYRINQVEN